MAITAVLARFGRFGLPRFAVKPVRFVDGIDDRDIARVVHDLDAVRARFERCPVWPSPGVLDERR
jgi:hypothetical protein